MCAGQTWIHSENTPLLPAGGGDFFAELHFNLFGVGEREVEVEGKRDLVFAQFFSPDQSLDGHGKPCHLQGCYNVFKKRKRRDVD